MLEGLFASDEVGGWWDADKNNLFQDTAGTTPVTADGDPVARINDKSGNGNHLLAGNAATYRESGGIGWVDFDGTADYLWDDIANIAQPNMLAIAFRPAVLNVYQRLITAKEALNANTQYIRIADSTDRLEIWAGNSVFTSSIVVDTDNRILVEMNGASSNYYLNGGGAASPGDMGTNSIEGVTIGANDNGDTQFFDGRFYSAISLDRLFTSQERTDVNDHFEAIYTEGQSYFDDNPISGTIEDEQGNPVENAIVKIFTEGSLEDQTAPTFVEAVLTDANGDWAMQAAYDETLSYKVEYKKFIAEYSVTIDSSTDSSFTVNSGPFTTGEFDDGQAIAKVTSGAADGDERRVTGNADTDTCDIDGTWSTNPSQGDSIDVGYMYSDELKFKPPKSAA